MPLIGILHIFVHYQQYLTSKMSELYKQLVYESKKMLNYRKNKRPENFLSWIRPNFVTCYFACSSLQYHPHCMSLTIPHAALIERNWQTSSCLPTYNHHLEDSGIKSISIKTDKYFVSLKMCSIAKSLIKKSKSVTEHILHEYNICELFFFSI